MWPQLAPGFPGQQRLILTGAVKKPCKGSGLSGSQPLTEIFRKQAEQASQQRSSGESTDTTSQSAPQAPTAYQDPAKKPKLDTQAARPFEGPTPRRLHFHTELDQQAHGLQANNAALAMTPSQSAAPPLQDALDEEHEQPMSETPASEGSIDVDYF